MSLSDFDKYFMNLPQLDRGEGFDDFWEKSISQLKRINIDLYMDKSNRKSAGPFKLFDVTFRGFAKASVHGTLYQNPKIKKPKVIIYLHDYNNCTELPVSTLDPSFAYFFLRMRGHSLVELTKNDVEMEVKAPGFATENILDPDSYYVKAIYLDAYRLIDALRLIPDIDCSSIGIIGKGLGAAAAMFCGCMHERISAIVLDSPLFANIPLCQNKSTSILADEINSYLMSSTKSNRTRIKNNLILFDILNFTDKIERPVLVVTGLKDTMAHPGCTIGFLNRLVTDKTIEIYPEEGNTAGGNEQTVKSIKWLKEKIHSLN